MTSASSRPTQTQAQFTSFWEKYGVWEKSYANGPSYAENASVVLTPEDKTKWVQNQWTSKMLAAKAGISKNVDKVGKKGPANKTMCTPLRLEHGAGFGDLYQYLSDI